MGLKRSHKCPNKMKVEGDLRREEKAVWPRKQRLEWSCHKPRKVVLSEVGAARSWKRQGRVCPRASGGSMPPSALGLWFIDTGLRRLTSRNVRGEISVILNHQVCGDLLRQYWNLIQNNTDWWDGESPSGGGATSHFGGCSLWDLHLDVLPMDFALKNGQTIITSHRGWCLLICTWWWCGKKMDWNLLFV